MIDDGCSKDAEKKRFSFLCDASSLKKMSVCFFLIFLALVTDGYPSDQDEVYALFMIMLNGENWKMQAIVWKYLVVSFSNMLLGEIEGELQL